MDEPDPSCPPERIRTQRIATATLAILLLLFGLWIAGTFVPALVWAAILTIAIGPLYTRAERRWPKHRRHALPVIAVALIAILVLAPLALGVIEATREAKNLFQWLTSVRDNGLPEPAWIANLPYARDVSNWWQQNLATPEGTAHQLHRINRSMIEQSQLLGKGLIRRSIVFLFTLLALFFTLRDQHLIGAQLSRAGERLFGPSGDRVGRQIILSVRGTIDGLVLVGIGEGVVLAIAYVIAGVPHPLLLGLLTAVAAAIPFGAPLLYFVAAALLLTQGSVGWAIGIIAIGTAVVFVADHFIRPVLIGGATRLPFLFVLIGILGGVETLGLLGLFVGPATMATLILLWRDYVNSEEPGPLPG